MHLCCFNWFHSIAVYTLIHRNSSKISQLYYLGFDDASCAACSFWAASWSAIVIDVNFLPIRSCISRYFATHRSRHTASPLLSSDSLYFGGTHFFWQAPDILQSNAQCKCHEIFDWNWFLLPGAMQSAVMPHSVVCLWRSGTVITKVGILRKQLHSWTA